MTHAATYEEKDEHDNEQQKQTDENEEDTTE